MSEPIRDVCAGIGFRRAAGGEDIVELVGIAFGRAGLSRLRLRALATAEDRAQEPAFRAAASGLHALALGLAPEALQAIDARVPTRSSRIEETRGVGSLAEAAALAAAGEEGQLVLARIASADGCVTCALALAPRAL